MRRPYDDHSMFIYTKMVLMRLEFSRLIIPNSSKLSLKSRYLRSVLKSIYYILYLRFMTEDKNLISSLTSLMMISLV